jgi:hypothetical protein
MATLLIAPELVKEPQKSIEIHGRRWFQKTYGNTYFSAVAIIDGETVAEIAFEYGYGEHYADMMMKALQSFGFLPDRQQYGTKGAWEAVWNYADRKGLTYRMNAVDVQRMKDL